MLLLTLALLTDARASGYYLSDVGVRSFSRGGAWVAGCDDLVALWYNPATLTRIKGGRLTLDVAGVGQRVTFDRAPVSWEGPPTGGEADYEAIENGAPPYVIPHFAVSHDLGLPNTTFALGFYPPYAPDLSYPADGGQRYTLTDTQVIQTFAGLSAAHEFADWVSVGAGLSWNVLYVEQELNISLTSLATAPTEDPQFDVPFALAAKDMVGIGWNIGLLVEPPNGKWAVGAMMQAPTKFSMTGDMSADFSQHSLYDAVIKTDVATDDEVNVDVSMPLILKGGVLVRPTPKVEIEAAAVWEGWSVIDEVVVTNVDMRIETSLGEVAITDDVVLPAGYQDTLSLRLGGEVDAHKRFTLRAGGLWEASAIPAETQAVSLLDGNKLGYGLGGTVHATRSLDVDLGWFQSFIPERTITDSEVRQIWANVAPNAETGEFDATLQDGTVVGNGTLSAGVMVFGAGLNWSFGKGKDKG